VERKIEMVHIQPGRPMQNGHVESFHGKLRDECLRVSWFGNLFEARQKIAAWRMEYNQERPHSSLGYRTPAEFARALDGECGGGKDGGCAPLENAARFPLSHRHGDDGQFSSKAVSNSDVVV
jgi:putative transposase